jgi:hypothetical protein
VDSSGFRTDTTTHRISISIKHDVLLEQLAAGILDRWALGFTVALFVDRAIRSVIIKRVLSLINTALYL